MAINGHLMAIKWPFNGHLMAIKWPLMPFRETFLTCQSEETLFRETGKPFSLVRASSRSDKRALAETFLALWWEVSISRTGSDQKWPQGALPRAPGAGPGWAGSRAPSAESRIECQE